MKALSDSATKDSSDLYSTREKQVNSYYLYKDQIDRLDQISSGNPSNLLRNILEEVLGQGYE